MKVILIRLVLASAAYLPSIRADSEPAKSACMLPPAPANGQYKVNRGEQPEPAKAYEFLALNYSCNPGYESSGNTVRLCIKGIWSSDEPKCGRVCKLVKSASVEYACVVKGKGVRPCKELEPEGTLVRPKCSENYNFCGNLPNMRCIDGSWDYFPTCQPVCGIFPNDEHALQPWLTPAGLIRVPWFSLVYKKSIDKPYTGWCSATLVTKNAVLTAAHCFWDRQIQKASSAEQFAVAVGKTLRAWDAAEDTNAQKFDVAEIIIHPDYPLSRESQNDIAVVKFATEVTLGPNVRPVCLDFDTTFEDQQLIENTTGLFVSIEGDEPGSDLSVEDVTLYVPIEKCISNFREEFQKFVAYDKICAGVSVGAHCFWDSKNKKKLPAKEFAVAVGKIIFGWNATEDTNVQKSDVADIIIHPEYPLTVKNDMQNNIAAVKLATEVTFGPDVRPVCLDFDLTFEQQQLQKKALGLLPLWLAEMKNETRVRSLTVYELPYVPRQECITRFKGDFKKYVSFDKICAGTSTGTVGRCQVDYIGIGNSGGGITYPEQQRGVTRYYLRGIATLTSRTKICPNETIAVFTQISKHENFIREFI